MRRMLATCALSIGFGITASAHAQCDALDFEDQAPGTDVSTLYPGVTFSAVPGTCGAGEPRPRIVVPAGGTSSGTRAIGIALGCPDFSDDYIRMVFDAPQDYVEFTVGQHAFAVAGLDIEVRAYSTTSGGGLIGSTTVATSDAVRSLVRLGEIGGTANIRRVEIETEFSGIEAFDDLLFGIDSTPPIVEITEPTFRTCACDEIAIRGVSYDPEGFANDRLEYRRVNADFEEPWTLVGSFSTPLPTIGTLYTWDVSLVDGGTYYVRVVSENDCGLTSSAITTIRVDKSGPSLAISEPVTGSEICGTTTFSGTVTDGCGVEWFLEYRVPGGPWALIAVGGGGVVNCDFATWNTRTVPDGTYEVRLRATDPCDNQNAIVRTYSVFNAGGCPREADLNGDGIVNGADLVILLGAWTP